MAKTQKKPVEDFINEDDTHEIQDYIKELGIEKYTSETVNKLARKRKKIKPKISSVPGIQKPVIENKKQNKKIVFDDSYLVKSSDASDASAKINCVARNQKPVIQNNNQNKKIVFDDSYLVKSSDASDSSAKGQKIPGQPNQADKAVPTHASSMKEYSWYDLLIKPDSLWYQQGKNFKNDSESTSAEIVSRCEEEGMQCLQEDCVNFQKVRALGAEKSENRWLQTVLKSGAFSDKIAAHTLLLQESPPHNLNSLKFLISLLDVKGRRECLASLDALLRLFTEGKLLNPNAKLKLMKNQPLSSLSSVNSRQRKELLALWAFEHQLKDYYNQFIQALDGLLKDAVETTRRKAIIALSILLAYSPEQEQGLLSRLVNKVGDPTRGVASTAVVQMEILLQKHSNMKTVVVSEVERLLYRPNISTKAQYYALCFLSQILFDEEDNLLATKMIIIYLSFFKACVKKGEVDSKLMAALLTGVRRAFPFTKSSSGSGGPLDSHVDTLFKLVHMVRFGLAVQALCILDQVVGTDQTNADRFYSVLFRKLFDSELFQTTKHSMFLNLLYCALKRDTSVTRLRCFVKRILQVCLSSPPQLTCGLLYLVSELLKIHPQLSTFRKVEAVKPYTADDDNDDEEHYDDIKDDDEKEAEDAPMPLKENCEKPNAPTGTWVHRNNTTVKSQIRTGYDPMARNPLFGRAEQSGGFWEINLLVNHFHPSVALFASTIAQGLPVDYTGDPLQDFTLVRFLDRFVFRNPKKLSATEAKGNPQRRVLGKRNIYTPQGVRSMAVDSKEFVSQPKKSIPVDEMFLYDYFKQRTSNRPVKSEKDSDIDSDMESVGSEEFEQFLDDNADLDFAADMKAKPKSKEKAKKSKSGGEDDEDDDEGAADSDLDAAEIDSEEDYDNDEEFQNAFKDFDEMLQESASGDDNEEGDDAAFMEDSDEETGFREEDVEFSDEEGDATASTKSKPKKAHVDLDEDDLDFALDAKASSSGKRKRNRDLFNSDGGDFMAAEDFAAVLESNAGNGLKTGGTTEALANKDKASVKQLQWEMDRDRWMKDRNRPRRGTNKKGGFKKGKKSLSRPSFKKNRSRAN